MQHTFRRPLTAVLAAVLALGLLAGCGERPLESVGQISDEWIGPIAEGVEFLPSTRFPSAAPDGT